MRGLQLEPESEEQCGGCAEVKYTGGLWSGHTCGKSATLTIEAHMSDTKSEILSGYQIVDKVTGEPQGYFEAPSPESALDALARRRGFPHKHSAELTSPYPWYNYEARPAEKPVEALDLPVLRSPVVPQEVEAGHSRAVDAAVKRINKVLMRGGRECWVYLSVEFEVRDLFERAGWHVRAREHSMPGKMMLWFTTGV